MLCIPTKLPSRIPNFSKVLKKSFLLDFGTHKWLFLAFLELNLKFWHEVGLNIKNARWKCCSDWPKEHENAKKTGGRCRINPLPSSTSLKYLRNERIDQRFHLLISKFVTFWSWRPSQSLHKKQLLRLNKTGKNPCFFKWLFIFNPNRHGESSPPL